MNPQQPAAAAILLPDGAINRAALRTWLSSMADAPAVVAALDRFGLAAIDTEQLAPLAKDDLLGPRAAEVGRRPPDPTDERDADATPRHRQAMQVALVHAAAAFAAGEVPVGAVVVDASGGVLGVGRNLRERTADPTAHAEVVALREAAARRGHWRLDDCELIVTLEPCPMCAGALVNARIGRVVYGCADPKAGACGSVLDLSAHRVLNHRFPLVAGVLRSACSELLTAFFSRKRAAAERVRTGG